MCLLMKLSIVLKSGRIMLNDVTYLQVNINYLPKDIFSWVGVIDNIADRGLANPGLISVNPNGPPSPLE